MKSGCRVLGLASAAWLGVVVAALPAFAETRTFQQGVNGYTQAADTYIDSTLGSQATTTPIVIDGSPVEQVLIRFDGIIGSGPSQIPQGSTITSATLTLRVGSGTNDQSANPVNYHRLLHAWIDTDVWAAYGVSPWNATAGIQADGADAVATAEATATMNTAGTAYPVNVLGSVQAWASDPASNYGWVILPTGTDGLRLESSESTTASYRPLLSVTYTPPSNCTNNADCQDGNLCTDDICNVGTGQCSNPPVTCPPGQSCDPATGDCVSSPGFTAYNDCVYSAETQQQDPEGVMVPYIGANVTSFGVGTGYSGSTSGQLLDQSTGNGTGVTVTLTQSGGVQWAPTIGTWNHGYTPHAGTDARLTFGGIADMTGVLIYGGSGWWADAAFTGLNPQKRYTFATSASRANPSYTTRYTRFTISGVDSATNTSTPGVQVYNGDPWQVYFNTGDNHNEGYVARWTDIDPGSDGSFTVRSQAHSGNEAYAFSVFMLEEEGGPCVGPEDCDDGNVCTADDCVVGACSYTDIGGPCNDGDLCTTGDTCTSGTCAGTPVSCPPGSNCDPATGDCLAAPQTVTFQQGDSNGYAGTVDTYIYALNPTTSYATDVLLTTDGTPPATDERQILIRFNDIFGSGTGKIPPASTITSATLTVNVSNAFLTNDYVRFNRMKQTWNATDTWNTFGAPPWNATAGIQADDVEAVAAADVTINDIPTGLQSITVTPSLQTWSADPASNFGWVLRSGYADSLAFDSSEGTTVANRPKLTVTYTQPGPEVTLLAPPDGATGVSANPTLSVSVTDPQSDPLDVTFYGREVGGTVPEDFTLVHITDTQYMSESAPQAYRTMMQWVNSNQAARNIVHLIHTGDITNVGGIEQQWINADSAMDLLEAPLPGLPYGVPYGLHPGNHDGAPDQTLLYNNYFGVSRFLNRPYYGGHYGADNDNNYTLFSAGGMDFIAIHIERWPTTAILDWADNLLKTYSNRRAIVGSHYIMEVGENASMSSEGLAIYNALKDNPNLFLLLCGHMHGEGKRYDDFDGRRIWTMIADYQDVDGGVGGWLRLLRFSPANNKIYVQTYSPTTGTYRTGSTSQFEIDYAMDGAGPFTLIDSFFDVVSGSQVDLPWPGRMAGETYEWYVDVSDGASVTSGPSWTFTSNGACAADADCDDGLYCNGLEDCPPGGGTCTAGVDPCPTGQLCNEATNECVTCVTDGDCNDNDPCTTDACDNGLCDNQEIDCSALDDDCNLGVCDPYIGACVPEPRADGTPCSDYLTCTIGDQCVAGTCVGTDNCAGELVCNPQTNTCTIPTPTVVFRDGLDGYAGTVDTYLRQQAPSSAHGTLEWFEWDASESTSGQETLGLLRFDNIFGDGFGKIPVGAEILSATLRLYVWDTGDNGSLRPALVAWDEATTYNDFGGEPGAQPDEYAAQVALVPGGGGYPTIDVAASIQAWASVPASNLGWLIYHMGSAGVSARSSEGTTTADRPMLTVTFRVQCQQNADCDDGNPCTTDTCNGGGECAYVNNTSSCNDGSLCTTGDTCTGGTCVGTPVSCPPQEACDPTTGACVPAPTGEPLPIEPGDAWRYFKGTAAPPANWNVVLFDDSGWLQGSGGFGYGADCSADRGTTLSDMSGGYVSLYTRYLFYLEDPDLISRLTLTVDYDDAFVAYINGTEVARRNVTGTPPAYNQLATEDHECSSCNDTTCNAAEAIELTEQLEALVDGSNVLAIQGHNLTSGSSDFSLIVWLSATMAPTCQSNEDCDDSIACTDDSCSPDFVCLHVDTCPTGYACNVGTGLCEQQAGPQTVEFQDGLNGYAGTEDTYIHENTPTTSYGADVEVRWDNDDPSGQGFDVFTLIRFGSLFTSQGGPIPDGAQITAATLTYTVGGTSPTGEAGDLRSALVDWTEATTYNTFGGDAGVQTDEYGTTSIASLTATATTTYTVSVLSSLQAWSADPAGNRGWIVLPTGTDGVRVRSSEYATAAERPKLTVTYLGGPVCDDNSDCDDNNVCNGVETCQGGSCIAGTPLNCNDGNPCTTDPCNALSGCAHAPEPDGTSCADSDPCDGAETCQGGSCIVGTPLNCEDGIACTHDECNPTTGCQHTDTCGTGYRCDMLPPGSCVEDIGPALGDVIISGFSAHPEPEWIELFNTTGRPIALDTMTLVTRLDTGTGDGTVEVEWTLAASPAGKTIPAYGFFLVGEAALSPAPDLVGVMDLATGEGGTAERAISIELVIDGAHMDYVLYGRHDGSSPAGQLPPGDLPFDGTSWPRIEVVRTVTGTLPIASFNEGPTQRLSAEDLYAGYDVEGFYTDEDTLGDGYPSGVWTSAHSTANSGTPRNSASPAVLPPNPECTIDDDCTDGLFCTGEEQCVSGQCQAGTDPCSGQPCDENTDTCRPAVISCQLASPVATPASSVQLEVFVRDVVALRGYQTVIAVTRTSGTGTVTVHCPGGVVIDTSRSDFIFAGYVPGTDFFYSTSCADRQAAASLLPGGVNVGATAKYLSEYELAVSNDAEAGSTFEVSIVTGYPGASYWMNSESEVVPFTVDPVCVLTIEGCMDNAECADGNPCTTDICDSGTCINPFNADPCSDGNACTTNDTCSNGACIGGSPLPCDDGNVCTNDSCDPLAGCQHVANAASCEDGQFCTENDHCANGVCVSGADPCDHVCEQCDEDVNTCQWCMFDLDGTGVIGGGDFALFSGCYGRCYPAGHACLESNFDGDPNGCVGGGDFGVFSGCYAWTCGQCANCWGPPHRDGSNQDTATVAVVVVASPTMEEVLSTLPRSVPAFPVGQTFYVEIWASGNWEADGQEKGLAAAYVDVKYGTASLAVDRVWSSGALGLLTHGVQGSGEVRGLGGCAELGEGSLGTAGTWVRVGTLQVHGLQAGRVLLETGPASGAYGIALFERFGELGSRQVDYRSWIVRLDGKKPRSGGRLSE